VCGHGDRLRESNELWENMDTIVEAHEIESWQMDLASAKTTAIEKMNICNI